MLYDKKSLRAEQLLADYELRKRGRPFVGIRGICEDEIELIFGAVDVIEGVALDHIALGFTSEHFRVPFNKLSGPVIIFHKDGTGGSPAERFKCEVAAAREKIQHPRAVKAESILEHVEDGALDAVGGGPDAEITDRFQYSATEFSRNDAQGSVFDQCATDCSGEAVLLSGKELSVLELPGEREMLDGIRETDRNICERLEPAGKVIRDTGTGKEDRTRLDMLDALHHKILRRRSFIRESIAI